MRIKRISKEKPLSMESMLALLPDTGISKGPNEFELAEDVVAHPETWKPLHVAKIEQSGSLNQKIRLIWGEGLFNLEKESPLCRAIYIIAKKQEEELKRLKNEITNSSQRK